MPTSPTGNSRTQAGFTLIELMIVVTIIALASAAVIWSLPDPRGRLLDEATRFAARARAARDLAVVDAQLVSLWVSPGGYGFDERADGTWVPIVRKPLTVTAWNKGTVAAGTVRERLLFDPTGLADRPLDVTLMRAAERVVVHVGAGGEVRVGG